MIVHKLMSKMSTLMSGVEGACSQLVRMIALVPSSSLHIVKVVWYGWVAWVVGLFIGGKDGNK